MCIRNDERFTTVDEPKTYTTQKSPLDWGFGGVLPFARNLKNAVNRFRGNLSFIEPTNIHNL